jgi:hypothetical protein
VLDGNRPHGEQILQCWNAGYPNKTISREETKLA